MIKDEIVHIPDKPYAFVTTRAFQNDVTARVAMSWIREHRDVKAFVVELPEDEVRPLLPGLIATFPSVQKVVVRCHPGQEAVTRAFIPFQYLHKLEFSDHQRVLVLGVVDSISDEGEPVVKLETIYPISV